MFLHKQDFVNKLYVAPSGTDGHYQSELAMQLVITNQTNEKYYLGQKLDHSLEN